MNNPPLTREKTISLLTNGTFYNPAAKHYNKTDVNVICDRCRKANLDMCIGYETYDMCLSCVQEANTQLKRHKEIQKFPPTMYDRFIETAYPDRDQERTATYMSQAQFRPTTMTNMEQAQFRPTYLTKMLQQAFRPGSRMYEKDSDSDDETKTFMIQSQFRY